MKKEEAKSDSNSDSDSDSEEEEEVGPGRYCSPRQRMPHNSRNQIGLATRYLTGCS